MPGQIGGSLAKLVYFSREANSTEPGGRLNFLSFETDRIDDCIEFMKDLKDRQQTLNGSALEKLPSDKQIVMHCKSGVRSAETLAIVKGAGYADAVHVGGGVAAWVDQIDPSQPAY